MPQYTVSSVGSADTAWWTGVSGSGTKIGNDKLIYLTTTAYSGGTYKNRTLALGQALVCTGYSDGNYKFQGYLFLSRGDQTYPSSSTTPAISSTVTFHAGSGNVTNSSYQGSTIQISQLPANTAYPPCSRSWSTGCIGISNEFTIKAGSGGSCYWTFGIGSYSSIQTASISITTTSKNVTMYFNSGLTGVSVSKSSITATEGATITTPNLSKTSVTEKGTTSITISFNSNGGTSCSPVTKTINTQRTVTADSNWAGTGVAIGGTTTISSGTWTASWSAGSWETISEASVGTLPKPTRTGYKFSGWTWNGGEVTSTTKFSTNATLVAQWTPVEYNIKYNMGTGTAKSGFTPLSIDDIYKTYATNATISTETPTWNDARQLFVDWKGGTSGNTYNVGATIGDAEYFEGASSSKKATLTGQWKDNPNTIYLKYYHPSSSTISTDTLQYGYSNIINQQIWKITNPTWTDRSFVGWIKADLVDDTWKNNYNTTKGVYESIDDLETTISKNLITQYSVSMSNQNLYLPWAHSETYYAIWVKTGKKIKLSSGWRDIQSVYFKGNDNKWHRVTDVWTKTSSGWKHEI